MSLGVEINTSDIKTKPVCPGPSPYPQGVVVDPTLTKRGQAADAFVTGVAISKKMDADAVDYKSIDLIQDPMCDYVITLSGFNAAGINFVPYKKEDGTLGWKFIQSAETLEPRVQALETLTQWQTTQINAHGTSLNDHEARLLNIETTLPKKLDKPEQAGTAGQVLSLDADGKTKWIDVSGEESSVAIVNYNEATFESIIGYVNAGKTVICRMQPVGGKPKFYQLTTVEDTKVTFTYVESVNGAAQVKLVTVTSENAWSNSSVDLEIVANKATTISDASTNIQYASAKAVYDFVIEKISPINAQITSILSRLNALEQTTIPAISSRVSTIEADYLKAADKTELEGKITAEKTRAEAAEATLQENIDAEAEARETADDALSERIKALEGRGRFLSNYDVTTGLPTTYPPVPTGTLQYTYEFKSGDYYVVSAVSQTATKYKPAGSNISTSDGGTTWTVNRVATTEEINTGDLFTYDGTNWLLTHSGSAVDNKSLEYKNGLAQIYGFDTAAVDTIPVKDTDNKVKWEKAARESEIIEIKGDITALQTEVAGKASAETVEAISVIVNTLVETVTDPDTGLVKRVQAAEGKIVQIETSIEGLATKSELGAVDTKVNTVTSKVNDPDTGLDTKIDSASATTIAGTVVDQKLAADPYNSWE